MKRKMLWLTNEIINAIETIGDTFIHIFVAFLYLVMSILILIWMWGLVYHCYSFLFK